MSAQFFSKNFIFTSREDPKVAECNSHRFLLKGCFLYMLSSGIYSYLPLGLRVLDKISCIIRKNMNKQGAVELLMSALQTIDIWQKTGRDKTLSEVMFTFKDRKERVLCLGPTHEEVITEIVKKYTASYRQFPFTLYQIQTKFRDEPRPRFGLVRSCEFVMKDAYSFDINEEGLDSSYQKMHAAYQDIFRECGLDFTVMEADSGAMGGSASQEFLVPSVIGEDCLFYCDRCLAYFKSPDKCEKCGGKLTETKMIELGHIFKLGTKYSLAQGAFFLDKDGKRQPVIMGCYGIGVSRLLPAIVEQNCDDKGIIWPRAVSPYDLTLVVLDDKSIDEAVKLSDLLEKENISAIIDDRKDGAGVKFNDAYLIGNPYIAIMGKNYSSSGNIEVEIRKTKEKISLSREKFIDFLKKGSN